ncbi:CGNR zinc finger domain-containing protein [Streptomonospora litoralis]|uniref:CGNR zinc finger n=1 Tax=Streptomonospora litoralis TaxID=2498135 RepID=A0A4V0ZK21_9ACTN|nr:CGNR zinc finger domain-containing protein [Streptomonospora litoralis]QBI55462.1 CGNR zinc finger [Streptomonospora litoralis]
MEASRGSPQLGTNVPLSGEPLALDLVNTTFIDGGLRGRLVDVLVEPLQLDRWLREHAEAFDPGLYATVSAARSTPDQLAAFRRLRQALRDCLEAVTADRVPPEDALAAVNRHARDAAHWSELLADAPVTAVRRWQTADSMRVAAGEIASNGMAVMTGSLRSRLRACQAPGCILFFVKSHPRREWCSPACGNRVRVARHGRRRRHDPDGRN